MARRDTSEEKLLHFFVLAYVISWILWTPSLLSANGLLPFVLPKSSSLAGNFGPALAAVILSCRQGGYPKIAELLRPLARWRVR